MKLEFAFILIIITTIIAEDDRRSPRVEISNGLVEGIYEKSYNGRSFSSFEGIPFARPPIGDLRFEAPKEPYNWTGTWIANTKHTCLQTLMDTVIIGDEDCLYLNVYVPRENPSPSDNFKVIVHIHGGGFSMWSSHAYAGPKYLMDEEVILVTINYRLGPLGVPQGSNLGPLLFIIFLNDLLMGLDCGCLGYADDLKIYSVVNSQNDCIKLQTGLTFIDEWCKRNKISLNVRSELIVRKREIDDLGVTFDYKLTFSQHVYSTAASASRSLGFLIRSGRSLNNISAIKALYCALVRSKMEYASVVWFPYYINQQHCIERVQKRFLKYLSFRISGVYPERGADYVSLLDQHDFYALSNRRENYSGKFMVNLLTNKIDSPSLLASTSFNVPARNSRYHSALNVPRARTNVLQKSPIHVMSKNFNKLYSDSFQM